LNKKVWLTWNGLNTEWSKIKINWEDLFVLIEVSQGGGGAGGILVNAREVWKSVDQDLKRREFDEEKRKRFLKIVVEVNGLKKNESRSLNELKKAITVDHIKNTLAQVVSDVRITAIQVKKI
jgi:hypothetical protein